MPRPTKTPAQRVAHVKAQRKYILKQDPVVRALADRRRNLLKRYGLTLEQFDAILTSQGNTCAICQSPDPRHVTGWRVDHNHTTGKVRGILCNHCNVAIGQVGENADTLFKIAVYLKVHDA